MQNLLTYIERKCFRQIFRNHHLKIPFNYIKNIFWVFSSKEEAYYRELTRCTSNIHFAIVSFIKYKSNQQERIWPKKSTCIHIITIRNHKKISRLHNLLNIAAIFLFSEMHQNILFMIIRKQWAFFDWWLSSLVWIITFERYWEVTAS
jgi:hypothetical protein